jgi:hypothetical protein
METKHTPGPWIYRHGAIYGNQGLIKPFIVAVDDEYNDEETNANSQLIAAAPELLEALIDAEFLLRKAAQVAGPMQDSFRRSAEDAKVAIAKATGGKP